MFNLDITPLKNELTEFTHSQKQSQQEIIALLKQNNSLLTQILQRKIICQESKT